MELGIFYNFQKLGFYKRPEIPRMDFFFLLHDNSEKEGGKKGELVSSFDSAERDGDYGDLFL